MLIADRMFSRSGIAGLLALILSTALWAAEDPDIDFRATALDGSPYDASALRGQVVLLDFWATWCGPCIAAFPKLDALQKEFEGEGLTVLGIASYSGTPEDVSRFLEKHPVDYTMVVGDEDLVERFGVIGYPTYFLIGRDGKLAGTYVGEMQYSEHSLLKDLKALLKEPASKPRP